MERCPVSQTDNEQVANGLDHFLLQVFLAGPLSVPDADHELFWWEGSTARQAERHNDPHR